MKVNFKINLLRYSKIIIFAITLVFGMSYLSAAWTPPVQSAPNGNVDSPLNVGNVSQIKSGGLWAGSLGVTGGVVIQGVLSTDGGIVIERRTSDPTTPSTGQMWLRTDI